jgi:ribosomal protein S18 acetylase RimI-like enzyme
VSGVSHRSRRVGKTGRVLEIRPATPGDLAAVGRIHALSRNAAYAGLLPAEALARVTPERQEAVWRERLADAPPQSALLVATDDGEVVGFTQGENRDGVGHLNAIHLLPERRGGGAGQVLHDALLARFAAWGCTSATLCVVRGNERAQSFYRRNGWTHDGTTSSHEVGGVVVPVLVYRRRVCATSC